MRRSYDEFAVRIKNGPSSSGGLRHYDVCWLDGTGREHRDDAWLAEPRAGCLVGQAWRKHLADFPGHDTLEGLGEDLADVALPAPDLRRAFLQLLQQARPDDEGVRLRILADGSDLADAPWELLYLPDGPGHVALRDDLSIVRTRGSRVPLEPFMPARQLRLMLLASRMGHAAASLPALPTADAVSSAARNALRPLERHGVLVGRAHVDRTAGDLKWQVQNAEPPDIVVSFGHGLLDADTRGCVLARPDGPDARGPWDGALLPLDDVSGWMHSGGPALWILAHCHLAAQARDFQCHGARGVLAMQDLLTYDAGRMLLRFCAWLAEGCPLEQVVARLRVEVHRTIGNVDKGDGALPDWFTPVLYLQARNSDFWDTSPP